MKFRTNIKTIFTAYLLLLTAYLFSQEYRNSGFVKPMNLPFNLAGSFGEPRPDHFHSGIDIKTNGVEGEPVFTIGDGYISRIRVSPYGYGKAIYITHPNGFTSVYGHLSKFYGAIEKYIHEQHYLQKKSELDLTLAPTLFPLKQSDTIAFSGNTGGSTAPHMHFEIRDTKTEHVLNALDFYPKDFYVDTIPPQINKIKINEFSYDFYSAANQIATTNFKNDTYSTDTFVVHNQNKFCISLEGFDKQDNSENKNGIKKIEVFQKDSLVFKYDFTEIDFDKTRMCNAFVDYNEMENDNGYFYNCYQLNGNTLPIYSKNGNGFISINNNENISLTIFCFDYNNNKTTVILNVLRKDISTQLDSTAANGYIDATKSYKNYNSLLSISISANTFYDNVIIPIKSETDIKNKLSQKYIFKGTTQFIPLQKPINIEFLSSIKKNRNKIIVVRQDKQGKETALKTTFDKYKFYTTTKELGTFYLEYDTTKPEIKILNLTSEIINNQIQVKIVDNLSGIDSYNGYLDGKWINFYYDSKNDTIEYNFDEHYAKGEHLLKIIVTDNVGNKNIVQQKFIY